MATNTDNVILLFKGDDTGGSFGRTVSFVISVEAGASMDGCRAEFEYAGIVKEIAPPIVDGETRTIEYSAEETAKMPLGAGRGVLRVIDAGGKVRTATNTLPVMVTDCVPLAYPGESVISVTFKAADYDSLSGKPKINGHTLTGNKSAADLGLAPAGNYATKADATLAERTGFSEWTVNPSSVVVGGETVPLYGPYWDDSGDAPYTGQGWQIDDPFTDLPQFTGNDNRDATSIAVTLGDGTPYTATRTVLRGYQLGSDDQHILASEAEAEALRRGKQDVLTFDNTPTAGSNNPVKSGGIWSAIWGALSALPEDFTSLYDWCVSRLADKLGNSGDQTITSGTRAIGFGFDAMDPWIKFTNGNDNTVYLFPPQASGAAATTADLRYALTSKTISNGAVTLDDRAINAVTVSSSLASLTVNFPTATSGKARDFGLRLTVASGITTAPELALPQGVTCENADGAAPEIGADGAATILYFTETASGVFLVKGEVVTAIS